jgi:hypothetical protein
VWEIFPSLEVLNGGKRERERESEREINYDLELVKLCLWGRMFVYKWFTHNLSITQSLSVIQYGSKISNFLLDTP